MSPLTTYGNSSYLQRLAALVLFALLASCGPKHVKVEGKYPEPLVDPIPISLGVWFPEAFRNHEFYDEAKTPGTSDWIVSTGAAQVRMWEAVLRGMFTQVVILEADPMIQPAEGVADGPQNVQELNLDAIFVPGVEELQYAIPTHTNIKVYEIWMRYRLSLFAPGGESIHDWKMTSYGKTPTAFLQSDEEAVNFAAIMALRDAGANFTSNFSKIPEIQQWLENIKTTGAPSTDRVPASTEGAEE